MFPNLSTTPLRAGSSTVGPCAASLSHVPSNPTPYKPVKPSAPRGATQKDYKDILQLAEGKETTRKRMCCKHLCPARQRKFAFHFPNSQEQSQIRTYSTSTCTDPSLPPSAKTEETTVLKLPQCIQLL